jgi:hypothetical protein
MATPPREQMGRQDSRGPGNRLIRCAQAQAMEYKTRPAQSPLDFTKIVELVQTEFGWKGGRGIYERGWGYRQGLGV